MKVWYRSFIDWEYCHSLGQCGRDIHHPRLSKNGRDPFSDVTAFNACLHKIQSPCTSEAAKMNFANKN